MKLRELTDRIKAARELIRDPKKWCQGVFYVLDKPNGGEKVQRCVWGALHDCGILPQTRECGKAIEWLSIGVQSTGRWCNTMLSLNDDYGHEWVMKALDFTIREMERAMEDNPDADA